jgi:hypothetical protein
VCLVSFRCLSGTEKAVRLFRLDVPMLRIKTKQCVFNLDVHRGKKGSEQSSFLASFVLNLYPLAIILFKELKIAIF